MAAVDAAGTYMARVCPSTQRPSNHLQILYILLYFQFNALLLQSMAEKKLVQKRAQVDAVDQLKPIAEQLGCSLAQLALAW